MASNTNVIYVPMMKLTPTYSNAYIVFKKSAYSLLTDHKADRKMRLILLALMTYPSKEFIQDIQAIVDKVEKYFMPFDEACAMLYRGNSISALDMKSIMNTDSYTITVNSIVKYHTNANPIQFNFYYTCFQNYADLKKEYISVDVLNNLIRGNILNEYNIIYGCLSQNVPCNSMDMQLIKNIATTAAKALLNDTTLNDVTAILIALCNKIFVDINDLEFLLKTYKNIHSVLCKYIVRVKPRHCDMAIFEKNVREQNKQNKK